MSHHQAFQSCRYVQRNASVLEVLGLIAWLVLSPSPANAADRMRLEPRTLLPGAIDEEIALLVDSDRAIRGLSLAMDFDPQVILVRDLRVTELTRDPQYFLGEIDPLAGRINYGLVFTFTQDAQKIIPPGQDLPLVNFVVEAVSANDAVSELSFRDRPQTADSAGEFNTLSVDSGTRVGVPALELLDGVFTVRTLPAAPSDLSLIDIRLDSLRLTWQDNAGDETAYELERSVGLGPFLLLAELGPDTTEYIDTDVQGGCVDHSYRVRAVKVDVQSAYSGTATANPCDADRDQDGFPDLTDNCPDTFDNNQDDSDGDGQGDACDPCPFDAENDIDGDGRCGDVDNCPNAANPGQEDIDGDGQGDACDFCPFDTGDDSDVDGICDAGDNCPGSANAGQEDADADGFGDVCDPCPFDAGNDADADTRCGDVDNCPDDANLGQEDADGDGQGDVCDPCPFDSGNDSDLDGVCDVADNCPGLGNTGQEDGDADGFGDVCDPCPLDAGNDADADGRCGDVDNCPDDANPGQEDADGDGQGDACDPCFSEGNAGEGSGNGVDDDCLPPIPTCLLVSRLSSRSVTLGWKDGSDLESGYEVERRSPGEADFLLLQTLPADSTQYDDVSVEIESTYEYRVRAVNEFGASEPSSPVSATPRLFELEKGKAKEGKKGWTIQLSRVAFQPETYEGDGSEIVVFVEGQPYMNSPARIVKLKENRKTGDLKKLLLKDLKNKLLIDFLKNRVKLTLKNLPTDAVTTDDGMIEVRILIGGRFAELRLPLESLGNKGNKFLLVPVAGSLLPTPESVACED